MAKITTVEQALAMVKKRGYALKYLPKKLKTAEVCLAAVQNNGSMLYSIPKIFKSPKVCLAAVQNNFFCIEYVSEKIQTKELISIIIGKMEKSI